MNFVYSIIIPHRDSLNLLQRAFSSIPDRSDIQVIIIDNSISELDFSILENKNESKITLLNSDPLKGAGHARNVGLKEAEGKWILFLDADDFFNIGAFEKFDEYKNSDFDIVYFAWNSVYSDTLKIADRHIFNNNLIEDFLQGKNNSADNLRYKYITPVCKLFKAKLILENESKFDEVPASNDIMFSVKTGHYAKSISANSFMAYCATINSGSLTNTISTVISRSRFEALIRHYKFVTLIGKKNQRYYLMAEILTSLRFGLKEFFWYISTSQREHVNIFLGFWRWPEVLYRYFFKRKKNDGYTVLIK